MLRLKESCHLSKNGFLFERYAKNLKLRPTILVKKILLIQYVYIHN